MGLKHTIQKLEDVPENVRTLYKQDGDKYVLDVEGVVPKERLDEFRTNNIELQKQLDKLKDVDPVKYAELIKIQREIEEGKLIKEGKLEEVVNSRVSEMKRTFEGEKTTLTTQLQTANAQLSTLLIDNAVKTAAVKNGVIPTAIDDVVLRARGTYVVENGTPVPKDASGNVVYGKDGNKPMGVEEWVTNLRKNAPHLFVGSQGSGAGGGNNTGRTDTSKLSPAQKISLGISQGGLLASLPNEAS